MSFLADVSLAILAFAATNIDDLFLLVAYFGDARFHPRDVALGQFLGMGALVAASFACALLSLLAPAWAVGWLGLIPVAIGLRLLLGKASGDDDASAGPAVPTRRAALAVAAVCVAHGGDNLSIYIPAFAGLGLASVATWMAVFTAMIGVWCLGAWWLTRHPALEGPIRRFAPQALPWILVGLGVYILTHSGALAALFN